MASSSAAAVAAQQSVVVAQLALPTLIPLKLDGLGVQAEARHEQAQHDAQRAVLLQLCAEGCQRLQARGQGEEGGRGGQSGGQSGGAGSQAHPVQTWGLCTGACIAARL